MRSAVGGSRGLGVRSPSSSCVSTAAPALVSFAASSSSSSSAIPCTSSSIPMPSINPISLPYCFFNPSKISPFPSPPLPSRSSFCSAKIPFRRDLRFLRTFWRADGGEGRERDCSRESSTSEVRREVERDERRAGEGAEEVDIAVRGGGGVRERGGWS